MDYDTVFEITEKGFPWWPIVVVLASLFVSAFSIARARKSNKRERALRSYVSAFLTIALGVAVFQITYPRFLRFQRIYKTGNYDIVEGFVENLRRRDFQESFRVNSVRFTYSRYVFTPGFNDTSFDGGPIRDGMQVRICHYDGTILKLEIKSDQRRVTQP